MKRFVRNNPIWTVVIIFLLFMTATFVHGIVVVDSTTNYADEKQHETILYVDSLYHEHNKAINQNLDSIIVILLNDGTNE